MKFKKILSNTKRNFSFPTSHFSSQRGYTLIELLTVIGILSVIVVSVVFISLRGSQKSDKLETVRQGGDTALSQMVRSIRYAKTLNTPASCVPAVNSSSITITSLQDNGQTTYSCNANTISSNSASLIDTNAVSVTACSFTCSQQRVSDPPTIQIQFSLSAKNSNSFTETQATIPFQTSVTLRNYIR